jgi:hypothetical protein
VQQNELQFILQFIFHVAGRGRRQQEPSSYSGLRELQQSAAFVQAAQASLAFDAPWLAAQKWPRGSNVAQSKLSTKVSVVCLVPQWRQLFTEVPIRCSARASA